MKPPPPRFDRAGPAAAGPQGSDAKDTEAPSEARESGSGVGASDSASMPPPPGRSFAPPPPRFSATGQQSSADARKAAAKAAAAAAAAAAVAGATPAQRDRLVAEAASIAIAAATEADHPQAQAEQKSEAAVPVAPRETPALSYDPPAWGGPPEGLQYGLEVLKGGQMVETHDISFQNHYTFGRSPNNHIVLDHPSSSRLHAIIQFELGTGNMFIFDNSSTHGTFLNKKRLKAKVYAPVRVGDMIKFGQSSRLFVVTGPDELRPEEGPSLQERRDMRMLAMQAERREHEAQIAKAQMAQALAKSGVGSNTQGASWGLLGEEAENEDDESGGAEGEVLDWRVHAETKGLTDKQQKTADKIRKYEWKMKNLQTEADRIRAKENGSEGLSVGQATQLARNEQALEKLQEEMEDLEEVLLDSIRASVRGKKEAAARDADKEARKAAKRRAGSDGEDESDGEDDDFYDRTIAKRPKGLPGAPAAAKGSKKTVKKAVTVDELFGRKEALLAEAKRLREAIALEEAVMGDSGDQLQKPEPSVDPLDAFMSSVETSMEVDKLQRLKQELQEAESEAAATDRLLKIADPDGWFRPKSKAAADAKAKAANKLLLEKQRKAVEEAAKLAAKQREAETVPFVPEEEDEDCAEDETEQMTGQAEAQTEEGRPPSTDAFIADQYKNKQPPLEEEVAKAEVLDPLSSSKIINNKDATSNQQARSPGTVKMRVVAPPRNRLNNTKAANQGGLLSREELAQHQGREVITASRQDSQSRANAAVMDALAVLSRGKSRAAVSDARGAGDTDEAMVDWKPPEGQTGDGRTALNDKLGY